VTLYAGATLTPLVGRDRELRGLESMLSKGVRLITLLGPGGSGKTRLAREVFDRRRGSGDNTYFVDLVGVSDPALVPAEIAIALGVSETADFDASSAVAAALGKRVSTLILDNLEELTGARDFLAGLLHTAVGLQVMATSRIPLGIPGEIEFQVPPLELPQDDEPASVETSPAGSVFLDRARAVGRLAEVDEQTARAISELCRRLDGLPLALELAAARTRIMAPATILRYLLEHKSGILATGTERDNRHSSLESVLTWSLELLGDNEAKVLSAVAICPGGFDLALAEALAPDMHVVDAIDILAMQGLLLPSIDVEGEPWYQLLETIRTVATERAPEPATETHWRRLAGHLCERVARTDQAMMELDEAEFRRLDALLPDIRAALDWTETNDPSLNLSLVSRFAWYWRVRVGYREAIQRLRTAIAANRGTSSELANALTALALMERSSGGTLEAATAAAEAARIGRMVGDSKAEVYGLGELVSAVDEPVPEVADRLREMMPTLVDPLSRYLCLLSLAVAGHLEEGFSDGVVRQYQDAKDALSGTSYRRLQGIADANLAQAYLYSGRPRDAFECSTHALVALREAGPEILGWALGLHAIGASMVGQAGESTAALRAACQLAISAGAETTSSVMLAAVVVFARSSSPLLAAKAWGAFVAGQYSGSQTNPQREHLTTSRSDRAFAESLLVEARRASDPVAFELAVSAGRSDGPDRLVHELLTHLEVALAPSRHVRRPDLPHGVLTSREVEVLGLVGAGKSDADIAAELFISPKTASVHVSNAKAKLGVETRLEVALWARERGLVDDRGGA
jgi:predicted ATPase/DNA-binding CsgD family transcriptional regulator